MLQDILNGQEKSNFVLITDEVDSCGKTLLLNALLELLTRLPQVIVVCMERPPQFFKSQLPSDLQFKVKWVDSSSYCLIGDGDIFEDIKRAVVKSEPQTAIIIDSLSTSLFLNETPFVCCALHKIVKAPQVCQLIALLHRDVHDESTQRLLKHQASSVLELSPGPHGSYACDVRHCRPTGKVLKSTEAFRVDKEFLIHNIQPLNKMEHSKLTQENKTNEPDPTSQLTFNLSLTSSEKEARSQVVLPYLKDRSKEDAPSQGRIYYQADDVDDLDEEDPDDDLNI